jgi:hypothetical protein
MQRRAEGDAWGTISRIAGNGARCRSELRCGDREPTINATLNNPYGIAVHAALNVYVADFGDQEVRKLSGAAP